MENTIHVRVYDFLKNYPPFNMLAPEVLQRVSAKVEVRYYEPRQTIFRQGELPGRHIFVVREGAVQLLRSEEEERILYDECDEGDVFGIRPLLAEQEYLLTAVAVEETLLYAVNIEGWKEILDENPRVSLYLATNFAAGMRNRFSAENKGRIFLDRERLIDANFRLVEIQSIENSKEPVVCPLDTPIQQAATIMSDQEVGSIIVVNDRRFPIGIVTDRDLRRQVVTGQFGLQEPVDRIMSSPVITISPEITVADVQILMVKHQIHHICITEDGTAASPVIGVISEHDLLVIQGNNPAILVREIKKSRTPADLRRIRERAETLMRKYLYQEVAISFISTVMTEINDAIMIRAIEMSLAAMDEEGALPPEAPFCFIALGSQGRGEQLLRTDQDNALIFDDVPEEEYAGVKDYYLRLSVHITAILNQIGYDYCPGDMMASNPKWCKSLQEWKEQFGEWIYQPNPAAITYCTIFFDYRPVYGDRELPRQLTDHIFQSIEEQNIFLGFLAKNALQNPPPLSFFRNFVVESSGEHKDEFDIKKRAMMPLADAARTLILEARVPSINNTFRRFEKLAELEPQNRELFEQAAEAYEILIRYRAMQGLKNNDSGRFFNPSELSKMERLHLRNSFRPISELQSLLTLRFQLNFIR
ncbi:MAG: CBS domain-containing protein [Saprospiraceae bacterium]|nr:CBS domain-containing protein [Saprospiraceae bacterium]MCB0624839.1 CBS domain-containing protein [Saprospiraceae bacterium]MCB0678616.1 CBS domain-containing protein [Saprospiraceae bacterium]